MIQKIKDLMKIKEGIDEINKSVSENKDAFLSLKQEMEGFKQEFNDVKQNQDAFLNNFKENLGLIKEMRERLDKEIYDFRLLKAQTQKRVMEKFEEELSKELSIQTENLRTNISEYNKLRDHASSILSKTSVLGDEISKFTAISRNIKKEDFELTRFAGKLLDMDKEKLELMRKIDTLERLVSRMRRSR